MTWLQNTQPNRRYKERCPLFGGFLKFTYCVYNIIASLQKRKRAATDSGGGGGKASKKLKEFKF